MLGCEVAFDAARAKRLQELIEDATGHPCPCRPGLSCPLLPPEPVLKAPSRAEPVRDST